MEKELLSEAVAYFKVRTVYQKVFAQMRDKYSSRGSLGGSYKLSGLTSDEKNQLGGFLKKDYSGSKQISISYTSMEKALAGSKFGDLSWEEILTEYFGSPLLIKKQEREREAAERTLFWKEYISKCSDSMAGWLSLVLEEKNSVYRLLQTRYTEDKSGLLDLLNHLQIAFNHLPIKSNQVENIAVFAASTTGDPHYFDVGQLANKLLLYYVQYLYPDLEKSKLSPAEFGDRCLFRAGILRDTLSNMCLTYGIHGWKKNGELHSGIEGFYREKEPVQLTLQTLSQLKSLSIENNVKNNRVYIVENPAVFSYLINQYPEEAVLCSNGQLRLACYVTMDLFEPNVTFYYAGDFDPEGLQIAQSLKQRYGDRLVLWQYQLEHYQRNLSDVFLDEKRLKKLERVSISELQDIKEAMLREKRAVYQESMLDVYAIQERADIV